MQTPKDDGASVSFMLQKWAADFVSGGVSAALAKTSTAPLERLKLLYQTSAQMQELNAMHVWRLIVAEQGVHALWRGNMANIIRYFPAQAFMLSFKEQFHTAFQSPSHPLASSIAAGASAGVCALTIVYPLDYARTRMAADMRGDYRSLTHTISRALQENPGVYAGLRSVYAGWLPGALCYSVYRGLQFGMYDYFKHELRIDLKRGAKISKLSDFSMRFAQCFALSFVCTSAAATVAYPLDTLRRACIVSDAPGGPRMVAIAREIYVREQGGGVPAFYRGLCVNYARNFGSALVLVLFDGIKPWFHQRMTTKQE
jgi:solute carrier family 25 (adenine nucleotide translocator) protein 4/5/6/31